MNLAPLQAALEALDAELADAQAERAAAEAQLHACEQRVQTLEAERAGIASYVRRHEGNQGSHIPWSATEPESDWSSLPRSEAVARVLAEASVPNSPAEIVSRGSWVLVTEAPDDVEGPDPDYEASVPDDADHEPSDRHDDGYWDAIASEIDQEEEPPL